MVDDMRVYIANLGKYNEGELVGDWFSFPIDEEDVSERIGLNSYYEEYAVHDTDAGYSVTRICSCDTGLGVWSDVSLVRSRLEAWRELWREVPLRVQEIKPVLLLPEETGVINP